jgi:hypothetical protein
LLRPGVFAVAPREPIALPMVSSTLFPQLPPIYRNPFRIGMGIMLLGVVAFSALRLLGPLVSLVALGVPALFVLYLWQADVWRDMPIRALVVAAAVGAVLGAAGWDSPEVWSPGLMGFRWRRVSCCRVSVVRA